MSKRTDSPGLGSLVSALLTAVSTLVVTGFSAVVGVVIAREFGRTDETDGFFAAYGVFIVLVLAAQAIRVSVLPEVTRARDERRLAGELTGLATAVAVVVFPLVLVAWLGADPIAELLAGGDSDVAQDSASDALRWIVPAAAMHLFAGLAASGLAALDDYATAAFGYAAGSAAGLALILTRVEQDGIIAVAWGMTLNAAVALAVPVTALAVRSARARMPTGAARPSGAPPLKRLRAFAGSATFTIALQILYVVCLPFAARLGTGAVTSFGYAFIGASALVAVTASSIGLVSSVPLTRAGMGPHEAARHVVSSAWLALTLVAVTAAIFALVGETLVEVVLGDAYAEDVGAEIGELVVALSPWMVASIGVSVAFPLLFVAGRTAALPLLGVGAIALQVPLAWILWRLFELTGLALSLALTTLLLLAALVRELDALRPVLQGLAVATATLVALTALAFLPPALVLGSGVAVVVGTAAYVALVAAVRPRGLRAAWGYLRTLG